MRSADSHKQPCLKTSENTNSSCGTKLQARFIDPDPANAAQREEHKKDDLLDQIRRGTYAGTQLALTELYDRIDHKYVVHLIFD